LPALETDWQAVADVPTANGTDLQVTVTAPTGSKFYRLKKAQ
jgi:hypothetical protein